VNTVTKIGFVVMALVASACGCPVNDSGVDSRQVWTAERDAACAAVEGCDADFVAAVPVYEEALSRVEEICDEGRGCFCVGDGCPGAILMSDSDVLIDGCDPAQPNCWYAQHDIALHEYVHAAFRSIGQKTGDHPEHFEIALQRARAIYLGGK
jgi:hypothetical protein